MENNSSDDELFKEYMKDVKLLSQDQHGVNFTKKSFKKIKIIREIKDSISPEYIYDPILTNQDNWLDGEDIAHFSRNGPSKKTLQLLKSGKINWEARLDLHHYTASAAISLVDEFLTEALNKSIQCVLIIHGKGLRTPNQKPILKNILIEHLRQNLNVLAYHSAKPSDGGTGAVYVILKKMRPL